MKFTIQCLLIRAKLYLDEYQYRILKPDAEGYYGKAEVSLIHGNDGFYIYIEAPDTGSLRTSLSSIARLIHVIYGVEGLING
ncbi:KEOPS complex subunit Pcc1 [Thermoplasma acidophilum]|uniref:KEOPS complex subunit Pcc1 n=1 Tax=Thermoplasma acidophilum TaxID=2303 RepID=UPI0001D6283C|nr:KEOPS complex subunit Pcc1 [Thermoplasma acidophilum]MCY0851868.1 KEOPS complex subunit Pcc1 [Thermoplasma acidophilum]